MAKKLTNPPELTPAKRRTVAGLLLQAFVIHGVQLFVMGLGVYLAWAERRGWPPVVIAGGLALWMQTQLPTLPPWLERMRPNDD